MSAHDPLSNTVLASSLIRNVPIMNWSAGHDVPATIDVTASSPSAGSLSSTAFCTLISTFDAVMVLVVRSIVPVTSSLVPTFTSAQVPCSNRVVAVSMTVNVPTWNVSVGQAVPAGTPRTVPSPSLGSVTPRGSRGAPQPTLGSGDTWARLF